VSRPGRTTPFLRALDEARFGPARTLNLRAQQPTAVQAAVQCEAWLRTHQAQGTDEVLVITGRGAQSEDGYSPVREAIVRLLPSLRRRNVIDHFAEHTPGSFVVRLASLTQLFEMPRRRREPPERPTPAAGVPTLAALSPATRQRLERLAADYLDHLGVQAPTRRMLDDEVVRQFTQLARSVPGGADPEAFLRAAIDEALTRLGR
jgi:hypothetical protein